MQTSIEDIYRTLVELADQGRAFVLAVVLGADGSTPCKAGSKAIVDAEGVIQGTIGGGLVEAETQRRAAETIRIGRPIVLDFNLEDGAVGGARPICGGAMRVLMDPTAARHRAAYDAASALRLGRRRGVLLTTVRGRKRPQVAVECLAAQAIAPELGFPGAEAARSVLEHEEPRLFVSESTPGEERLEVFVEPLMPRPTLLIVGGGHVGQAVAAQAALVGFDIVVIDDRPEFTRPELFPRGATAYCGSIGEEVARFPIEADTYVVIVTRGHQHDADALAACLHQPAAYVGMIGSRRKVAMMRQDLVASGRAAPAEFDHVYAPIGLDIGSVTVPEIAACIVAQLIAVRRKGAAPRISTR
ncbi:MAG: XdhC family protein [Pirellulales bacterium]|nr:XdhC family protein [Pirellulales bacterium]